MSTLVEILKPEFLLHDALVGSVIIGVVCPLVGVYFVLRRMIFLGVALPQLSAAGIACAFFAHGSFDALHAHGDVAERTLAMIGSFGFTVVGLSVLAALDRRGREMVDARIGFTYAAAAAVTILVLASDPHGDAQMVSLLKGDILATTASSLRTVQYTMAAVVAVLFLFRKELLLVSFDRELALVFGKRVWVWDGLLYLVMGLTISLGVTTAGPIVAFGFLVVPPLTARLVTRRMLTFSLASAAFGGLSAFWGFYLAYAFDLPLGPAQVALACVVLLLVSAATGARHLLQRTTVA